MSTKDGDRNSINPVVRCSKTDRQTDGADNITLTADMMDSEKRGAIALSPLVFRKKYVSLLIGLYKNSGSVSCVFS